MRTPAKMSRQSVPEDVGTLWIMQRPEHSARCALIARRGAWEVRVIVDGELLLEARCARTDEAFTLAEQWRGRMTSQGWQQVLPGRREAFSSPNVDR
jgi:hypothetical protein